MTLELLSIKPEHLDEAASLVARRYQLMRQGLPVLPTQYEHAPIIAGWLSEMSWETPGVVAIDNGRLVGFLWAFCLEKFLGQKAIYCPDWANASEPEKGRRIIEEMYAWVSERWVNAGYRLHAISVFASDGASLEAWNWLGFGMLAVDSIRPAQSIQAADDRVEIVRANPGDADLVASFGRALERHLESAPIYWPHNTGEDLSWLSQSHNAAWLAYQKGDPAAYLCMQPGDDCDCRFLRDSGTARITSAFTLPEARKTGVATALLHQGISWAQEQGYTRVAVDFESANSLAVHFWMRYFDPVSYSMMRVVAG